ncbi:MAG TPA: hypothetical protein VKC65_07820 [Gaiellaceae bacterium]|nr:hypothetical protein [Gaiellaceae bacterium]
MDVYDFEYRRQYCRDRAERARDEYRRIQPAPKNSKRRERGSVAWVKSAWERIRRRAAQREPAYRA